MTIEQSTDQEQSGSKAALAFEPKPEFRHLAADPTLADCRGKRIGVLVVTYNAVTTLKSVLKRIPPAVWDNVEEVVVLDDASQDVFIVFLRRRAEFRGHSSYRTWLFGIASNVAHQYRRKAQRAAHTTPVTDSQRAPQPSPLEQASSSEMLRWVDAFLASIDEGKRDVFILAELEQMSGEEEHYEAKMMVLAENIRHHIKEEEGEMFAEAKKTRIDFRALGERMAELKERLKNEGIPEDAEAKMVGQSGLRGDSPAKHAQKTIEVPIKSKSSR